jgi:hypothetical protein
MYNIVSELVLPICQNLQQNSAKFGSNTTDNDKKPNQYGLANDNYPNQWFALLIYTIDETCIF